MTDAFHSVSTPAEWEAANPILDQGQVGVETNGADLSYKVGDGVRDWNSLPYDRIERSDITMDNIDGVLTVVATDGASSFLKAIRSLISQPTKIDGGTP